MMPRSIRTVSLTKLMRSRSEHIASLYPKVTVELDLSEVTINGNPRYWQLILDNLISNACKYANTKVLLSLRLEAGHCCLSFEDDGEGISPQQRQQILAPFTRLDNSRSRETGGFGLGLAIVNTVVRKMDAKLDIADSELGGAQFGLMVQLD